jgi:hypothetical protein
MSSRERLFAAVLISMAVAFLAAWPSLFTAPALASSGTGRIYQVTSAGGSPTSYTVVVDSTTGMAAADHLQAFVSGGGNALYAVTSVTDSTTVVVQDSLTEANGAAEFGAPATGRFAWGSPTANGLTMLPDGGLAWAAALRRNAYKSDSAADLSAITITGGTLSGVDISSSTISGTVTGTISGAGQFVSAGTAAFVTVSTVIPFDDTLPQNDEGDQVLVLEVTPASASSTLEIEFSAATISVNAAIVLTVALFVDSDADALAIGSNHIGTGSAQRQLALRYTVASGSTTTRTYKIRVGPASSATVGINGTPSARRFGGASEALLTIREILP